MKNKTIELILTRTSCREYSDKKVSLAKITSIAEAGKMAPSARNRQIANILVVRNKRYVEMLRKLSIKELDRDCFYGANSMILVHAPRDDKFCTQDCSCILENMFLAATSLGLGNVQTNVWTVQFPALVKKINACKTVESVEKIKIEYSV